ncbi:hypothetical protein CCH79_00001530 [Gambusia affinis]|uniref:EGF-like domain-containing protein n=1 Tax=Gambusia affinis TaxID=33528 RepID=A0A315VRY4_GAMAF|nr:hypothetical protein CCH79_00001530 [Gambusia affinis]
MKTKSSHGVLVYFDDEGFCDFLELLLINGKLSLRYSIFCAEPATVVSDTAVNDSQWHNVTIRRSFKNTTLSVDGEIKWVEVKSKRRDMTVFSHLFIGGIPPELRSVALRLTSAVVKDQPPFAGWITDIKVNNTESEMINSEGVLMDVCGTANMCLNGGVCSLINNEPTCDCTHTGFQGKDCSKGLAHLMMGDQVLHIAMAQQSSDTVSSQSHSDIKQIAYNVHECLALCDMNTVTHISFEAIMLMDSSSMYCNHKQLTPDSVCSSLRAKWRSPLSKQRQQHNESHELALVGGVLSPLTRLRSHVRLMYQSPRDSLALGWGSCRISADTCIDKAFLLRELLVQSERREERCRKEDRLNTVDG